MNLHGLVSGMVGTVNPQVPIQIRVSIGNKIGTNFVPTPQYASPITVLGQVQELSIKDLRQVEGLNLNGTLRNLYINGNINAGQRVTLKGGDIIILPDGTVWLVTAVPESWPDWCRALIVQQNDSSTVALRKALDLQTL